MLRAGVWLVSRAGRTAAAATGLMTLLALQPEPARLVESASAGTVPEARVTHTLVLSDQARRYLSLQYKSFATEFMGCMIGEVRGIGEAIQQKVTTLVTTGSREDLRFTVVTGSVPAVA